MFPSYPWPRESAIREKSQSTDFAEHGTITDPIGAYQ